MLTTWPAWSSKSSVAVASQSSRADWRLFIFASGALRFEAEPFFNFALSLCRWHFHLLNFLKAARTSSGSWDSSSLEPPLRNNFISNRLYKRTHSCSLSLSLDCTSKEFALRCLGRRSSCFFVSNSPGSLSEFEPVALGEELSLSESLSSALPPLLRGGRSDLAREGEYFEQRGSTGFSPSGSKPPSRASKSLSMRAVSAFRARRAHTADVLPLLPATERVCGPIGSVADALEAEAEAAIVTSCRSSRAL